MAPLVTNAGDAIASGRMIGATPSQAEPKNLQWGTSATAEAKTQTTLVAAAAEARVAGTSSQVTVTVSNDTYQVTGTITSSSGQTIQEVGLFDAAGSGSPATGGNMFMRGVHGSTTLNSGDGISYTIKVTFN